MDGVDVESGDGLYKDQSRMQTLLCRTVGSAIAGDGAKKLSEWVQDNVT